MLHFRIENHFAEAWMQSVLKALAFGAVALVLAAPSHVLAATPGCSNPNALGVSRTIEIDTTGGPGFGFEHYKAYDFLQAKEVVLTFDDGPQKFSTEMVLAALAEQCTKAIFFSIGKMALGYPEIIREVAKAGHTIGSHTWSHLSMRKAKTFDEGRDEIERGSSGVKRALGGTGLSPFFRFPALEDTPETIKHLSGRNIAMWSTDIDSFDFKPQPPEHIIKSVMAKLEKRGKGIILLHDIHKTTAKAVPGLLAELKAKGYKVVHVKAKGEMQTLPEFDALIEKDTKGLPTAGTERPQNSVVRTIEGQAPAEESAKPAAEAQKTAPVAPAAVAPAPAPVTAPTAPSKASATEPDKSAPSSTAASAPASPVTTIQPAATTTTASVKVSDDPPPQAHSETSTPPAAPKPAAPTGPQKSISERAKELWELWFGK